MTQEIQDIIPIDPALNICATPKNRFTFAGRAFRSNTYSSAITVKPSTNPAIGDITIGTTTFHSMPLPSHQCFALGCDHTITFQSFPAAARAAPHSPPISA